MILSRGGHRVAESVINPVSQAAMKLGVARSGLESKITYPTVTTIRPCDEPLFEALGAIEYAEELATHARDLLKACIQDTEEAYADE